jgi:EmrB/QacA subfamily drug resistance transporter
MLQQNRVFFDTDPRAHKRRWAILSVLSLSLFLVILDNSITNVALPTLARDLHASITQLQWIVDSYSLTFASFLLPFGSLADRLGRRRMLLAGLVVFGACSVIAAFAATPNQLIAARAAQGIGAAMVFPCTLAILINVFTEPVERAKAIGLWSTTAGLAVALGPMVGGALLEHFWWGSTFLVNVPVVVVSFVVGREMLPESKSPEKVGTDVVGLATSVAAIVAIVYAVIEAPRNGWTSQFTLGFLTLGVVLAAVFVAWEKRSRQPMLDVRVFANPRFSAATLAIAIGFFALLGSIFLITQYLQVVRGYSTFEAGLHTLPFAVGAGLAGPVASFLGLKIGTKITVALGLTMMAGGYFWMATVNATTPYWGPVVGAMVLVATGLTITTGPATEAVVGALPPEKAGVSSAMNDTSRELGGTLGVAVIGSVFSSVYGPRLAARLADLPVSPDTVKLARQSVIAALVLADRAPPQFRATLVERAQSAFLGGMTAGMRVAAVLCVAGAIGALRFLPARAQELEEAATMETDDLRPDPWQVFLESSEADLRAAGHRRGWDPDFDDDLVDVPALAMAGTGRGGPVRPDRRGRGHSEDLGNGPAVNGSSPDLYPEDPWAEGPDLTSGRTPTTYEYAVLTMERRDFDRVALPDGSVRDVERHQSMAAVEAWFDLHVLPDVEAMAKAAYRDWEDRYAQWRSQVQMSLGDGNGRNGQNGHNGHDRHDTSPMALIRLPEGTVYTAPPGRADELLRDHFADSVERRPYATVPTFKDWLRHAGIQVETKRGWKATLRADDQDIALGFSAVPERAGPRMPATALATLNRLGREGWELVSIDEDPGGESVGRGGPTAIHYVLKRALSGSQTTTPSHYPDEMQL